MVEIERPLDAQGYGLGIPPDRIATEPRRIGDDFQPVRA